MSEPLWASMDLLRELLREAVASRALDGDTQHAPQADWLCCLDHARERIAELEVENNHLKQELWIASGAADDAAKRAWWNQRVMEMEATNGDADE